MNISLRDKTISFKVFVKIFGRHFNSYRDPEAEMKSKYTQLTGRKVGTKSNSKKDKEL